MVEPTMPDSGAPRIAVLQAEEFRRAYPPIHGLNGAYQIFYDETNNAGHVMLSSKGFPSEADRTFVLGGIALNPGQTIETIDALRQSIKLQSNAGELKFRHVAHGDYEEVLSSQK